MEIRNQEDYVASIQCPRASVEQDYEPELYYESGGPAAVLLDWAKGSMPWRRYSSNPPEVDRWMLQTKLNLIMTTDKQAGPSRPPNADNGHWLPSENLRSFEGRGTVELMGDRMDVEFTLPFYHESRGIGEAVFCDLRRSPPSQYQWKVLIHQCKWVKACFQHVTDTSLAIRYVAPIRKAEKQLEIPHTNINRLLRYIETNRLAPIINPGAHCDQKKEDANEYRCPLRENGQCNPLR